MPRPKMSLAEARLRGADRKNPSRFRGRHDQPKGDPIGEAPEGLNAAQRTAWNEFVEAWPWVAKSDRAALELLCIVAARVRHPNEETRTSLLSTYRQLVAAFGGSPTSRNRIDWRGEEDDRPNPFEEFQRNHR